MTMRRGGLPGTPPNELPGGQSVTEAESLTPEPPLRLKGYVRRYRQGQRRIASLRRTSASWCSGADTVPKTWEPYRSCVSSYLICL
jgi:hypothetical protein